MTFHPLPDGERPEQELAARIGEALGLDMHKLPEWYPLDYVGITPTGHAVNWWELKCRSCGSDDYGTAIVDLQKLARIGPVCAQSLLPAYLALGYADGVVRYVNLTRVPRLLEHVRVGGRTDRGDSRDVEPLVHIPVRLFSVLP